MITSLSLFSESSIEAILARATLGKYRAFG